MADYIYYYSGTGNSFYLASHFSKLFNIEAKSINECEKYEYDLDRDGMNNPTRSKSYSYFSHSLMPLASISKSLEK